MAKILYRLSKIYEIGQSGSHLDGSLQACIDHATTKSGEVEWSCANQLRERVFYENGQKLYGCPHCCDNDDDDHQCNTACFSVKCGEIVSEPLYEDGWRDDDTHWSINPILTEGGK